MFHTPHLLLPLLTPFSATDVMFFIIVKNEGGLSVIMNIPPSNGMRRMDLFLKQLEALASQTASFLKGLPALH